jgi:hypothetical protein
MQSELLLVLKRTHCRQRTKMMVQRGHAQRVAAQHIPLPTPQQRVVAVDPAVAVVDRAVDTSNDDC